MNIDKPKFSVTPSERDKLKDEPEKLEAMESKMGEATAKLNETQEEEMVADKEAKNTEKLQGARNKFEAIKDFVESNLDKLDGRGKEYQIKQIEQLSANMTSIEGEEAEQIKDELQQMKDKLLTSMAESI